MIIKQIGPSYEVHPNLWLHRDPHVRLCKKSLGRWRERIMCLFVTFCPIHRSPSFAQIKGAHQPLPTPTRSIHMEMPSEKLTLLKFLTQRNGRGNGISVKWSFEVTGNWNITSNICKLGSRWRKDSLSEKSAQSQVCEGHRKEQIDTAWVATLENQGSVPPPAPPPAKGVSADTEPAALRAHRVRWFEKGQGALLGASTGVQLQGVSSQAYTSPTTPPSGSVCASSLRCATEKLAERVTTHEKQR